MVKSHCRLQVGETQIQETYCSYYGNRIRRKVTTIRGLKYISIRHFSFDILFDIYVVGPISHLRLVILLSIHHYKHIGYSLIVSRMSAVGEPGHLIET